MMRAANSAARVFFPAGDLPDWATAGEGIGLWANWHRLGQPVIDLG